MVLAAAHGAPQAVEALSYHQQRVHLACHSRGRCPPSGPSTGAAWPRVGEPGEVVSSVRNIVVFMGTRPEAIKLAPVVAALGNAEDLRCTVVATGQHREMFRQVSETFGFMVDADLDVMRPNQTLAEL